MHIKNTIFLLVAGLFGACNGLDQAYFNKILSHRNSTNHTFFNPQTTPLDTNKLKQFTGLKFYEVNPDYKVTATLTKYAEMPSFELPHSHQTSKPYKQYGTINFSLGGNDYELTVLEAVIKKNQYKNYLLICFTDLTTGKETYSGGRYLDIETPQTNQIELDFNLAYHPYCVYNNNFVCPIPPKENFINTKIEAGERL